MCVLLIVGDSGAGNCAPEEEFARSGVEITGGAQFPRVTWGPTGAPRFNERD